MKLSDLLPHLLYQFKSEVELVRAIEEISHKFTKDRDHISDYLNEPKLVSAYTAFYLLSNIPKLEAVLKWMPSEWVSLLKKCPLIDLGAGPGTFSLAWKALGGEGETYQVETSPLMREQGKKIWSGLYPDQLSQGNRWDWKVEHGFVLFGHSMNEMGVEAAVRYIEAINPEHILFIEPGTKSFFPEMLKMRDYLLSNGFHVLYPCPKPERCPMKGSKDWCHQFIHVKQDAQVERLSQMARLDRKLLPLTVQAFSRSFQYENPQERLVRVLPETKFSFEWEVCRSNNLLRYQLMKRDLSRVEAKGYAAILAGEAILTETVKDLEQSKRVKLHKIVRP